MPHPLGDWVKQMTWGDKGNDNQRAEAHDLQLGYWVKQHACYLPWV
jgi:hypothetical protein